MEIIEDQVLVNIIVITIIINMIIENLLFLGLREQHDVATMIKYATEKLKWDNILLFGSSQGGASSLLGVYEFQKTLEKENKTSNISCMIVENAFSEKGKLWKSAIQRVLSGQKFGRSDMSKQSFGSNNLFYFL